MVIDNESDLIKHDEGFSLKPYKDTEGHLTFGWGTNLETLDEGDAQYFFLKKLGLCIHYIRINYEWARDIDKIREAVVINICYNVGNTGFSKFKKLIAALKAKDYKTAAAEILDSDAARKLPVRYGRLAKMMETGEWPLI